MEVCDCACGGPTDNINDLSALTKYWFSAGSHTWTVGKSEAPLQAHLEKSHSNTSAV